MLQIGREFLKMIRVLYGIYKESEAPTIEEQMFSRRKVTN